MRDETMMCGISWAGLRDDRLHRSVLLIAALEPSEAQQGGLDEWWERGRPMDVHGTDGSTPFVMSAANNLRAQLAHGCVGRYNGESRR